MRNRCEIFKQNDISLVMHFAGLKSVPESIQFPLSYYEKYCTTINLLKNMKNLKLKNLYFHHQLLYIAKKRCCWNESSGNFS